jgi:hypothetical protein
MNLIETNLLELRAGIVQRAEQIAQTTTPVARVEVSQAVGFTVADLLDLEANEYGRYALVLVSDPAFVKSEIALLRQDATPVVRRMFSAFVKGLDEAMVVAQSRHTRDIANKLESLLVADSRRSAGIGRPFARLGVVDLVRLNNELVGAVTRGRFVIDGEEQGSDNFRTLLEGTEIYATTRSRFKVGADGTPTHSFRHTISASGSLQPFLSEYRQASGAERIFIERHNSSLGDGVEHIKSFVQVVLTKISDELSARVAECAEQGMNLVVTKTNP